MQTKIKNLFLILASTAVLTLLLSIIYPNYVGKEINQPNSDIN